MFHEYHEVGAFPLAEKQKLGIDVRL